MNEDLVPGIHICQVFMWPKMGREKTHRWNMMESKGHAKPAGFECVKPP
jgi:hypothetical protein